MKKWARQVVDVVVGVAGGGSNKYAAALACAAVSLLGARTASAAKAHPSVVVWAEGPDAAQAHKQATDAIGRDYTVVDPADLRAALARSGQRGAVTVPLLTPKKRSATIDKVRAAAREAHVDDVVVVMTSRTKRAVKWVDVMVIDAAGGGTPDTTHFVGKAGDDGVPSAVQAGLAKAAPPSDSAPSAPTPSPAPVAAAPAASTPSQAADAPEGATPKDEAEGSTAATTADVAGPPDRDVAGDAAPRQHVVGQELFQVSLGIEGGMRHFEYTDGLTNNLRPYNLGAAPIVAIDGAIYPLAGTRTPVVRDLGLVFEYARAFALQSAASDGTKVTTQWSRYSVGGRFRIRTGSVKSPVIGLSGVYGDESFGFETSQSTPTLPSVEYKTVRAAADVRIPIGRFAVLADAGYLVVLSAGDVAGRFPKSSVGGVQADLGGAWTLTTGVEARLTASYRRFFYTMNPTPGDGYVAGGALDELAGLQASIAYVF